MYNLSFTVDGGPINTVIGEDLQAIAVALHDAQQPPELVDGDFYYGHFFISADSGSLVIAGYGIVNDQWGYYNGAEGFTPVTIADFIPNPRTLQFVPTPLLPNEVVDLFESSLFINSSAHSCGYVSFYNV